jgi:EAL domain-containing protein (putative c-di-GMP-specific phosphodiesterase class I)
MAPHELHIEITERLLMDNPNNARDILESCQQDGMLISIDDFGTGYSSLSYLHHFPINILKVDRSFINNMTSDKSAFELVKSIISLSHNLGMKVIAEGIETQQQADLLKQLKCDQMQGYHYAKPMPLHDFLSYLQNI